MVQTMSLHTLVHYLLYYGIRENVTTCPFLIQVMATSPDRTIPEWSGWSTHQSRSQGQTPATKTHIIYHPLIMAKPSDPSTVYTSMIKARHITAAAGQEHTIYTADQQLFKVAIHIIWQDPEGFSDFIPRLGGMHFLTNIIGCIGGLATDSGCAECHKCSLERSILKTSVALSF